MAARKKKVVQAKARIRQTLCDLRQQQDAFLLYVQGINKKTDEVCSVFFLVTLIE